VEAEAYRDGLCLTINKLEITKVILEMDSLQLLSLWSSRLHQGSEIVVILQEIEEMEQPLDSFYFAHVKRSANNVTHLCAMQISQTRPSVMCQDQPPSFVSSSL
jgi:hypothetical protein